MASSLPLSSRQLSSLQAVVNALIPPLKEKESSQEEQLPLHDLSHDASFLAALTETLATKLSATEYSQLKTLLTLLGTRIGTFLIFGITTTCAFSSATTEQRVQLLRELQHSRLDAKRNLFQSLKRLICGLAFSFVDPKTHMNPFWPAMGYPGPPQEQAPNEDFDTKAMMRITQDTILDCDVVIVGSGAGGGVAAATLAQQGYSVVILEKGPYIPPAQVTNLECEAFDTMYEKHGLLTSRDGNIMILAGSTLGGGTTVNWACCLPLPIHVQQEWAKQLPQFGRKEFEESMQEVQRRLGCLDKSKVTHNITNQSMKAGCQIMGYSCDTTGQNFRNTAVDSAGYTCFGDRQRNKQSGLVTYLSDAVKAGARIIDKCKVHRVLYKLDNSKRQRAVGVVGYVGEHRVQVNAVRCVIVAAGSLHTPCLLQRSGFRNKHIGRHLHLHPVVVAVGLSDREVHAYLGAPMTTVCNEFQHGQNGYGAKLECPCAHTGLMAAGFPYRNPREFQKKMLRFKFGVPLIVLQRDTSEGRVRLANDGFSPVIDYVVNEADQASMRNSLKGAIRILLASGSREVFTGHMNDPGLHLSEDDAIVTADDIANSDKIQEYLHSVDERGMEKHKIGIFSAHQMASCRMSSSSDFGVVDENGETWECDDLFVMDASAFPTASGANPMLTTLALSNMLSTRLASRLKLEDGEIEKDNNVETNERRKERDRKRARQTSSIVDVSVLPWTLAAAVVVSIVVARYWRAR